MDRDPGSIKATAAADGREVERQRMFWETEKGRKCQVVSPISRIC